VRDARDDVGGVVVDEDLRGPHGELLQRVPDPVVRAGRGEVVAGDGARGALLGDHRVELGGGPVDDGGVERAAHDDDARTVGQRAHQLLGRGGAQPVGVVDQHLLLDGRGVRVVGEVRCGRPPR
jgi:hypothetical protein